jgi:hypothetical protein
MLSPSARARARRWDKALDADRAAHRPDHNRDRATPHPASHADPGSVPNAHNKRVTPSQPNQHGPTPAGSDGGDGGQGAAP